MTEMTESSRAGLPPGASFLPRDSRALLSLRALQHFKDIFLAHGALGFRDTQAFARTQALSEFDRLAVVPLVFMLIPSAALRPDRPPLSRIKPAICDHLAKIGVDPDDDVLVSLLKAIADQYSRARALNDARVRKQGISDLRAKTHLYRRIRASQNDRCRVCGARLGMDCQETLDHIIPFMLLGDKADGANWQVLCEACNRGKSQYLCVLQSPEAMNWVYGKDLGAAIPCDETRFLTLTRHARCQARECTATASTARLFVTPKAMTGLPVFHHLTVLCEMHIGTAEQA